MTKTFFFCLCLLLSVPEPLMAGPAALANIGAITGFIADKENDEGVELDEQGKASWEALANDKSLAQQLDDMIANDEANDPEDASLYCSDEEDQAQVWDIKSNRRRTRGKAGKTCQPGSGRILDYCCMMYVRMREGIARSSVSQAKNFGSVLLANGYCKIGGTPRSAPIGAIMVYRDTGYNGDGHTEKKTGVSSFYFGPTNSMPATEWTTKKRTLTGIYVKGCGKSGANKPHGEKSDDDDNDSGKSHRSGRSHKPAHRRHR